MDCQHPEVQPLPDDPPGRRAGLPRAPGVQGGVCLDCGADLERWHRPDRREERLFGPAGPDGWTAWTECRG